MHDEKPDLAIQETWGLTRDEPMTKRDRFASNALQGLLASDTRPKDQAPTDELVDLAYRYADAMMRRRER